MLKNNIQRSWIDPKTRLEWHFNKKKLTWDEAIEYANSLGSWKVPTIKEFETLLYQNEFPFKTSLNYWTSITYKYSREYAWCIQISLRVREPILKTNNNYVCCVNL